MRLSEGRLGCSARHCCRYLWVPVTENRRRIGEVQNAAAILENDIHALSVGNKRFLPTPWAVIGVQEHQIKYTIIRCPVSTSVSD
jgi:hypothetical protein